jgi:hypothetical protein
MVYELPFDRPIHSDGILKKVAKGWQVNTIATFQTGNPITFYSNSNASFQNQVPDLTRVNITGKPQYLNPRTFQPPTAPLTGDCIGGGAASGNFWINPSNMECGACPLTDPSCTSAGDVGIPLFTYGNLGRNSVTGPGINNWDISIAKKTAIGEGSKSVEFRAEFFNAFNHVQFFRVDNAGGSSTFGQVLTDRGPRLIQFGLKLYF